VNDVSQKIVVLESIVDVDLLVVDCQCSGLDTTLLKMSGKYSIRLG
jgi:hypothetical protein